MTSINHGVNSVQSYTGPDELEPVLYVASALSLENARREALDLDQRARERRFYVACLGQFKRGKSTLLDALIGQAVLPSGILPVTAVPTIVRYGGCLDARVRLQSGEWTGIPPDSLNEWVSETKNPGNRRQVSAVEVFVPSPLLASGMCLVDTPGLGSIFRENTDTTLSFLPHVDAAIIVIGADPPLSADELAIVETTAAHVRNLIFVLNKADKASEPEREQAIDFAQRALQQCLHWPIGKVLEISATEWLQTGAPTRDGNELVGRLQNLAAQSGSALAKTAWTRGIQRLSRELLTAIAERRGALTRPAEDSRRRISLLREQLNAAQSSLRDLSPSLAAEQTRMEHLLAEHRESFLRATVASAEAKLQEKIALVPFRSGPRYRRELLRLAQEVARDTMLPWLQQEQSAARTLFSATMERFITLAGDYLRLIRESLGLSAHSLPTSLLSAGHDLSSDSRFQFHDIIRIARPVSPFGLLRDLALGVARVPSPFAADAGEFLKKLLTVNSSRIENDCKERIALSRKNTESEIRRILAELVQQAETALTAAQQLLERGQDAMAEELHRLSDLEEKCLTLPTVRDV